MVCLFHYMIGLLIMWALCICYTLVYFFIYNLTESSSRFFTWLSIVTSRWSVVTDGMLSIGANPGPTWRLSLDGNWSCLHYLSLDIYFGYLLWRSFSFLFLYLISMFIIFAGSRFIYYFILFYTYLYFTCFCI